MILEESYGIIALKKEKDSWITYLVKLKSGNHWGFPKGHAFSSETNKQAAKRELFEETKLEVEKFLLEKPLIEQYQIIRNSQKINKKVYYYLALVKGEEEIQKNEIIDGMWIDLKKAKNQITYKQSKNLVDQIFSILNKI